ncbi:MAG: hypothetical protein IMZ43_09865 [Thermoplasmata archaeon]|nr:hypothetical protein [Thermoplasmata archaeon]
MKLKIIDESDGSIQGWFVALVSTAIVYGLMVAAFIGGEKLQAAWINIGGYIQVIYSLSFGSWLAYRAAKAIAGK